MKCPNCGREVGETPFCPQCGADMTSRIRRRRRFLRKVDRAVRQGTAAAIVFVTVLCVLVVVLSAIPSDQPVEDPFPSNEKKPPEGSLIVGDDYVILGGDFGNGLEASLTDDIVVFSVSEEISASYSRFVWELRSENTGVSYKTTKDSGELEWISADIGRYTVTVICQNDAGEAVLNGTAEYMGDSEVTYKWTHSGRTMSVTHTVTLESYLEATSDSTGRNVDTLEAAVSFVDPEGAAASLEEKVWAVYSTAFSHSRTSSDYASCLLEMLSAITCVEDYISHGASVYWSTPEETLYLGVGDSGDIAVLAASLLGSAGFDTALVKLPDTWSVGVSSSPEDEAPEGCTVLGASSGGVMYWLCDVVSFRGIGIMDDCYGYSGTFTFHGRELDLPYGICPC